MTITPVLPSLRSRTSFGLALPRRASGSSLVQRLVELPTLPALVRALPAPAFAGLVRRVGLEDASEIVACASTEQLIAAFDEDVFHGAPGERASFDAARFVRWLEALREAGEDLAARRLTELSEDFVVHALDALLLVLDLDALRERMSEEDDDAAERADKALESALSEEIDGYLLVARDADTWDVVLALLLVLDRDDRAWLVRILDRLTRLSSAYVDDLDELASVLSASASLAEDVEAAREDRRSAAGYVEPRAARAFLRLAREPDAPLERDAGTRAYFRALRRAPVAAPASADAAEVLRWLAEAEASESRGTERAPRARRLPSHRALPIVEALHALSAHAPEAFEARMEELTYLANVLVAGGAGPRGPYRPLEAAEAALATVCLGVALEVRSRALDAWVAHLAREPADHAFRRACARAARAGVGSEGVVADRGAVAAALARLAQERRSA